MNTQHRPLLSIRWKANDYLLESISLIGLTAIVGLAMYFYPTLPDMIAVHYNLSGEADRFGSKDQIWILVGITVVLYAGLTILNRFPHIFNYPVEIREDNAEYQYILATRLIRVLKLLILLIFFNILYITTQSSLFTSPIWILLEIGLIFCSIIGYLILASRRA